MNQYGLGASATTHDRDFVAGQRIRSTRHGENVYELARNQQGIFSRRSNLTHDRDLWSCVFEHVQSDLRIVEDLFLPQHLLDLVLSFRGSFTRNVNRPQDWHADVTVLINSEVSIKIRVIEYFQLHQETRREPQLREVFRHESQSSSVRS